MNNNLNAIGVIGPLMAERSVRDRQLQREFGGCNAVESYCGTAGVGAGNAIEPRTARDMAMLARFNTCGTQENYCGYASAGPSPNVSLSSPAQPYATINDNPYLPNGGRVQYVPLGR